MNHKSIYSVSFCVLLIAYILMCVALVSISEREPVVEYVTNETVRIETRIVLVDRPVPGKEFVVYQELLPPYMRIADSSDTSLNEAADRMWNAAESEAQYVAMVETAVQYHMMYQGNEGRLEIRDPYDAWGDRMGDCSEYALIMRTMLRRHGIGADYIYGNAYYQNGTFAGSHARVRVEYDVDALGFRKEFRQIGSGMYPGEWVAEREEKK